MYIPPPPSPILIRTRTIYTYRIRMHIHNITTIIETIAITDLQMIEIMEKIKSAFNLKQKHATTESDYKEILLAANIQWSLGYELFMTIYCPTKLTQIKLNFVKTQSHCCSGQTCIINTIGKNRPYR